MLMIMKNIKNRGLVMDLIDLPFPVTFNQGGFIESVKTFNMDDYLTKVTAFKDRLGISESGHASQSLGDRLLEEMSK